MQIRRAVPDDAVGIAAVHVASWQGAYRGTLPQAHLDALDVERYTNGWGRLLARTDWPRQGTFLAEERRGEIVGFLNFAPARDDDAGPAVGEVTTIYALPAHWGRGVGRALMDAAEPVLREAGYEAATLWVLRDNPRARGFYEACGWSLDGTARDEEVAGAMVTEVRYRRPLGPSADVRCPPDRRPVAVADLQRPRASDLHGIVARREW